MQRNSYDWQILNSQSWSEVVSQQLPLTVDTCMTLINIDMFYFLGVNGVQKDPTSITMNKCPLKCFCGHLNVVFPVNTVYLLQSLRFCLLLTSGTVT